MCGLVAHAVAPLAVLGSAVETLWAWIVSLAALLSASGMECAAGEPGVRCGRVWVRLLSPSLPLSLKCGCSVSSLMGSAASSFPPVVTWSCHGVG